MGRGEGVEKTRKKETGFRTASVFSAPDKLLNLLKILRKTTRVVTSRALIVRKACRAIDNAVPAGINEKYLSDKRKENAHVA